MDQSQTTQVEVDHDSDNTCGQQHQNLWSWGAGTDGQLGTNRLQDELSPQLIRFPSADSVTHLACGGAHTIALTSSGKVFTWGRGTSGQLGHGDMVNVLKPKVVEALSGFVVTCVAAGWSHSGFVTDMGILYTCGDGSFGQLGHGDSFSYCTPKEVSYFSGKRAVQIACGMRHSLALVEDGNKVGEVYGFGSGRRGQLGVSDDKLKLVNEPCHTLGLEDVPISSICACGDHSAALSIDGEVYTWGRGFSGSSDINCPRRVNSGFGFTQVCLGWNHALFLTGYGEVFMLGCHRHENSIKHQSRKVTNNDFLLDRVQIGSMRVSQIASGAEHSAFVTEDGKILIWGWGEHGQLGLGNTTDETSPQKVGLSCKLTNELLLCRVSCGSGFTFAVGSFTSSTIMKCNSSRFT